MAAGDIISEKVLTRVDGKTYYTFTSTKVTQGNDGKVNGGEITVNYSPKPDVFIPAAITKDGGKTWTYLKYKQGDDIPNGKKVGDEIFGNQLKKSLEGGALKTNTNNQIKTSLKKAGVPDQQQKPLTLSQTTASPTTDPSASTPAASDGKATEDDYKKIQNAARGYKGRKGYSDKVLRYPEKMNTFQDCIKFTVMEYQASQLGLKEDFGNFKLRTEKRNPLATIILPMPSGGISDRNTVNWQDSRIGNLEKAVADSALQGIIGGLKPEVDSV
jgi:hypothetical protein